MSFRGRILRCAAVVTVGLAFAPAAASAAPPDTVPVETVPSDTVPVETVPVDTVPGDAIPLPEGCAQVGDVVMCIGPAPVPYESVGEPLAASPEAVVSSSRAIVSPAVAPVVAAAAEAPEMVASEAPVPAPASGGAVTLGHRATQSVKAPVAVASAPTQPDTARTSPVPVWAITLLLGAVVALAGVTGFRRARPRS